MAQDFAQCMRDLVDIHYPQAERIRLVLDNLSTHTAAALYQSMPPQVDRRIDCRERLIAEIEAWEHLRNASGARIHWMFSTGKARQKLAKAYPVPACGKPS